MRGLDELAFRNRYQKVRGIKVCKFSGHRHDSGKDDRAYQVENGGDEQQVQGLAPRHVLIASGIDHVHHVAGSQIGAQEQNGEQAYAEK